MEGAAAAAYARVQRARSVRCRRHQGRRDEPRRLSCRRGLDRRPARASVSRDELRAAAARRRVEYDGGMTTPRIDYHQASSGAYQAMQGLERFVRTCGLEHSLLELVKTRASQINGCAYCIDMHTKDARAAGETEQRLYALSAWEETSFYTPRERAALLWTEAITNIQNGHAPDAIYEEVRKEFSEGDLVRLTFA